LTSDYRNLPSVDRLLAHQEIGRLLQDYSRNSVLTLVRRSLEQARSSISNGATAPSSDQIVEGLVAQAKALWSPSPRPVINATGVVLHTNLGRAPLSNEAVEAMRQAALTYTDLELDLEDGKRGSRQAQVQQLLCQLTGAEAALVVNNNAAAVLLGLVALAEGREVIVSRGEAVEIGGGFRVPDVLRQSGATLVEVGTTNRTYARDYAAAVSDHTAAFLRVHPSNFQVTGFTHAATTPELAELGRTHGTPVLYDLGSGCLLNTERFGLSHEPTPQEAVEDGADLVFFSGDKLLGGPQAGIVVGKEKLVQQLARHPLARAVRIDKMSLAALSATLLHYVKGDVLEAVPIWRMISSTVDEIMQRADVWRDRLGADAIVVEGESTVGGGSLPGETLPTRLVALPSAHVDQLALSLRQQSPPVIGRIESGSLHLDPRTVLPEQDEPLIQAVLAASVGAFN